VAGGCIVRIAGDEIWHDAMRCEEVLMRLLGITIEEFRSVRGQWLPADGLVVLFGPNSAGKTSVLEAAVELLMAGSHLRTDPGLLEDVWAQGSVWFALPRAGISGSPDAELYRAFLTGGQAGGHGWDGLTSEAADVFTGKTADDARSSQLSLPPPGRTQIPIVSRFRRRRSASAPSNLNQQE